MKELDKYLPSNLEEILESNNTGHTVMVSTEGNLAITADAPTNDCDLAVPVGELQEVANVCFPTILN